MIEDWARLCTLLDDDPELRVTVALADSDPWVVIVDGLDDAGALAYLEENDVGAELADALAGLPRVFRCGVDLGSVADVEGELSAAIVHADDLLAPHGLRIVYLEEDTDAVPLVVVPIDHVDEILALSERLGHTARVFS